MTAQMTGVDVICLGGVKSDLIAMISEFVFTSETSAETRVV